MEATESTGSATTGPTSFSEVTWSDAPSASTPTSDTTSAAPASADATVPPASDETPDGQAPAAGAPPPERWDAILSNARQKAAQEAVAAFEQQYGWAKQINQQELATVMQMAQRASADPINYLQDFIKELQVHPTYGPQLKTLAARALAARTSQEPAEPQPDLPIQLEDGRVVKLYSAEQQAKREAWLQQQFLTSVQQQLQPVTKTVESWQQAQAQALEQAQTQQFTARITEDIKSRPGVDDAAMQAIAKAVQTDPHLPAEPSYEQLELAVERAYRAVVLPHLSKQAEAKLLDSLQQKAAASTSVNPGSAAPSSPRAIRSFHQLGPDAWR